MEHFFEVVLSFLSSAEGASLTIAMVVEFVLRMVKTEKPKSILYGIAYAVKKSGEVLTKVGNLLDKILPQKLK